MVMSLDQAVTFAKVFQDDSLSTDNVFDSVRIKRLSQEERKVCNQALQLLKNAQLDDFNNIPQPGNEFDANIFKPIILSLREDWVSNDYPIIPFYEKPFLWIAHLVQSLWKGIQNLFGRMSTAALYNEVENYRYQFSILPEKLKTLEAQLHKVKHLEEERKEIIDNLSGKDQKDLSKKYFYLEMLTCNEYPLRVFREAAQRWHVPNYEIEAKSFKNVAKDHFSKASPEIKLHFNELIMAAEKEDSTQEEMDVIVDNEYLKLSKEYEQLFSKGDKINDEFKLELNRLKNKKQKIDLMRLKLGVE